MLSRDRIGALIMLAFSIGYGLMIFRIPLLPFQAQVAFTARTMPQALCLLGIVLSLVLLFKPASGETAVKVAGLKWKTAAALCALMVFYGFTIRGLGFLISTNVFLIGSILILGERRAWLIFLASVPIVFFFWVLLTQFLGVYIAPWPEFLTG